MSAAESNDDEVLSFSPIAIMWHRSEWNRKRMSTSDIPSAKLEDAPGMVVKTGLQFILIK